MQQVTEINDYTEASKYLKTNGIAVEDITNSLENYTFIKLVHIKDVNQNGDPTNTISIVYNLLINNNTYQARIESIAALPHHITKWDVVFTNILGRYSIKVPTYASKESIDNIMIDAIKHLNKLSKESLIREFNEYGNVIIKKNKIFISDKYVIYIGETKLSIHKYTNGILAPCTSVSTTEFIGYGYQSIYSAIQKHNDKIIGKDRMIDFVEEEKSDPYALDKAPAMQIWMVFAGLWQVRIIKIVYKTTTGVFKDITKSKSDSANASEYGYIVKVRVSNVWHHIYFDYDKYAQLTSSMTWIDNDSQAKPLKLTLRNRETLREACSNILGLV